MNPSNNSNTNNIWSKDYDVFLCDYNNILTEKNFIASLEYLKELAQNENIPLIKLSLFEQKYITGKNLGLFMEQNDIFEFLDLAALNLDSPFKIGNISEALVKSKNLKEINLYGNDFVNEFASLVRIIKENKSIEILNIGSNDFYENETTDDFKNLLPSFSESLETNKTLKTFEMISISPDGDYKDKNLIEATFNGLENNTSITKVDLSQNYFTDDDCKFIKVSSVLKKLDLSSNIITKNGVETILNKLQNRTTKLTIDLKYNEIMLEDLNLENKSPFITLLIKDDDKEDDDDDEITVVETF